MNISVVIPALNEADQLAETLAPLQAWRTAGDELILVDGGSRDGTASLAEPLVDQLALSAPGRAVQMNAGAARASRSVLLFLHADTRLPDDAREQILAALTESSYHWGRFDVRLSGRAPLLRLVERMMNVRSCLTGIATGDQAIFVERALFEAVGGYQTIPLMEDIRLSRALLAQSRPCCLRKPLITSSRRWEEHGVIRTILLMWRLRLLHALGHEPAALAALYRRSDRVG